MCTATVWVSAGEMGGEPRKARPELTHELRKQKTKIKISRIKLYIRRSQNPAAGDFLCRLSARGLACTTVNYARFRKELSESGKVVRRVLRS